MRVRQVGALTATGSEWEPYRLVDPDGVAVEAVSAFFRDLQAAGRSTLTVRSHGMDLLRWFRFLWAAGVEWDRVSQVEARDFCRWMQVAGKPLRTHWRRRNRAAATVSPNIATIRTSYAPSVRAHSETVLRSFYGLHLEAGTGRWSTLSRWPGPGGPGARMRTTTRWSRIAPNGPGGTGPGWLNGTASKTAFETSSGQSDGSKPCWKRKPIASRLSPMPQQPLHRGPPSSRRISNEIR